MSNECAQIELTLADLGLLPVSSLRMIMNLSQSVTYRTAVSWVG